MQTLSKLNAFKRKLFFAPSSQMVFSSELTQKQKHKVEHKAYTMDPRHYENDFESTSINELEYVRTPFYDLAKLEHTEEGEQY